MFFASLFPVVINFMMNNRLNTLNTLSCIYIFRIYNYEYDEMKSSMDMVMIFMIIPIFDLYFRNISIKLFLIKSGITKQTNFNKYRNIFDK